MQRNGTAPNHEETPGAGHGSDRETRWYALYTRARHEKRVEARLRQRQFEVFLPLIPRVSQWHDRRKVVHWPLFPGYVFARFNGNPPARALSAPGVATIVRCNGVPAAIPDEEIENVRRFAAAVAETGSVPEPTPFLERGQQVRIVRGPFAGVEGRVVEQRGGERAIVHVGLKAIGQGLKVEVDARSLKVMHGSRGAVAAQ